MVDNAEELRLNDLRQHSTPWRKWGPYLSERQWGTVREDYSASGDAWNYFTHDQARSRAYRWGEDGIAGISDDRQLLCFALALWNGRDPILKERLFGLTNAEGNHGEDVKEYYFYLDNTPTHAYMRQLYKYPQAAFPYEDLVRTNRNRNREQFEYELLDTGVFEEDRYFDVVIEYAKAAPEDLLVRVSATNRGPQAALLHLLPTLWFRNTWSGTEQNGRPVLHAVEGFPSPAVVATHPDLGDRSLFCEGNTEFLFTENETNTARLCDQPNASRFVKDGINDAIVHGRLDGVNPERSGTKVAVHAIFDIPSGATCVMRLRLTDLPPAALVSGDLFGVTFDEVFRSRRDEADEFYTALTPPTATEDEARVMRQALAGMLWNKQYYAYDLGRWLDEHQAHPFRSPGNAVVRNQPWFHMLSDDIISMPDKWEYPWYAAWDLAFHTAALALVDIDFAKHQLDLLLNELYLHPNGQIPAYEWNFSDVNPPVHAWASYFVYNLEVQRRGKGDTDFLERVFSKLVMNFTWWVNRKDPSGRNVFEGGFLGLDNIGVFDRSAPLPTGGSLEQADGTAWMAFYCQCMLSIAIVLAENDADYEPLALKFVQHFLWIAAAMDRVGERSDEMWDEADGLYCDLLRLPDGSSTRLKVHSLVGLLPLCAATVIEQETIDRYPEVVERIRRFLERNPELTSNIASPTQPGVNDRRLLAIVNESKLRRILEHMLAEDEFLSPHGIRSVSRFHREHPYTFNVHGRPFRVDYLPAESNTGMFGGNSNWRGPVWFPINTLIVRALLQLHAFYGDSFKVRCPTGSGPEMSLFEVARELSRRLTSIFLRDDSGHRPVFGGTEKFQSDPHWRDNLLFYEYFHGDNGAGLGASHQTGWTGLVATLIALFGTAEPADVLRSSGGLAGIFTRREPAMDAEERMR